MKCMTRLAMAAIALSAVACGGTHAHEDIDGFAGGAVSDEDASGSADEHDDIGGFAGGATSDENASGSASEHDDIGGFAGGAMSDEDAIRAMDALGNQLAQEGDYVGVYKLFEPAFRDACPLEPFVRMYRLVDGVDEVMRTHERDGEIVRVDVDGDRAVITSLDYSPARDYLGETTDEVVRIDGRWFIASDAEGIQACAAPLLSKDYYADAASAVLRFGVLAGGIATGSVDGHGLYLQTFTMRFQDDCPFDRYQAAWPFTYDRFTSVFSDPFTWDLAGSDDYVEIKSSEGRIATLMLEGGEWRIHEIAGLTNC